MADLNSLLRIETGVKGKNWTLKNNDDDTVISGQYAPQDYTENAGAKIPEISTVNNDEPFPQWVGGDGETSSFTARIFRPDPGARGSVRKDVENLKKATKKDKKLFRAPIFTFTWGEEIAFKCFVVSVGGVRYDEITSSGLIKGAQFSLVLRKIENVPTAGFTTLKDQSGLTSALKKISSIGENLLATTIDIIGGSLHTKGKTITAKEGDTFESIAQKEYGDALVGDILRRAQPEKANLVVGDSVILVNDTEIFKIEVTPQSVSMRNTTTSRSVRQLKFEARNRKTVKVF